MRTRYATLICCAGLTLAGAGATAAAARRGAPQKADDGMVKKERCRCRNARTTWPWPRRTRMKKDDAAMKKDAACAEMVKKDDAMMKKEEPMKK